MVEVKKGDDIGAFLGKCKAQFPELRATSVENLMYIKVSRGPGIYMPCRVGVWKLIGQEDLIIPHVSGTYWRMVQDEADRGSTIRFTTLSSIKLEGNQALCSTLTSTTISDSFQTPRKRKTR